MDFGCGRFNIYLLVALAAALVCGCKSYNDKKKPDPVLRVHAEAQDKTTFTKKVTVYRSSPKEMIVDESILLNENMVKEARVVEALGGFALAIQFDKTGQWTLDEHTSLNLGRHLAIFAQFGEKNGISRWLAAPIISNRITDGMLVFTPDATRDEAEQLVEGLNRLAAKNKGPDFDKNPDFK
jgi:hypothetical protein